MTDLNLGFTDREWHEFLQSCKRYARAIFVSAIIMTATLVVGAGALKAIAVSVIAVFMHLMGLGTRRIEQLSFLAFGLMSLYWLNIIPLQRWFSGGIAAIDRLLMQ